MAKFPQICGVQLQKHAVKINGKRCPASYSVGTFLDNGTHRQGARIRSRCILNKLPAELAPQNASDMQTDYHEADKSAIYWEGSAEYAAIVVAAGV